VPAVSTDDGAREAARIRAAYKRRARRGADARYSLMEPAHLFHAQSLDRALVRALRHEGIRTLAGLRILDAGCGGGSWLAGLTRFGAEPDLLTGVDLRAEALPRAPSGLQLGVASADQLPFATSSFDLVCQLTMMSSVLDRGMRHRIAAELTRVLRPGGILLWYDFTVNPFNRDVAGVPLRQLIALFPGAALRVERTTLAPPLTRLVAPRSWLSCALLESVPWLRTHLIATIRPNGASASCEEAV
jgi:SAM-dependent methyltransferase